jgi:hypothetical protein
MEEMTFEQAREWGKTLDAETVWAAIMKMSARVDATSVQVDATAAQVKETSRRVDEMVAEAKKRDKRMGDFANTLGTLIETLIASRLWEKFPEYNLVRAYQRVMIYDDKNKPKTDVDILLVNGDRAMAVEVKREPNLNDVEHHLKRMELVQKYPPTILFEGKTLLGAIAGGVVSPGVKEYAQERGLFVLELNGEQVSRTDEGENFTPKVWSW